MPSSAARLFGPTPCASVIVEIITASEPTTATARGSFPSRIAGATNATITPRLMARPTSERAPRIRPKATTHNTNRTASSSMGVRRSKSVSV